MHAAEVGPKFCRRDACSFFTVFDIFVRFLRYLIFIPDLERDLAGI